MRVPLRLAVLAVAALAAAAALCAPAHAVEPPGPNEVRIWRDTLGIPHVEAADREGLAYGTGYALASDRLFLTAAIRLVAQGRSAELLGEPALEADVVMRRDFHDSADVARQYAALPESIKRELEAYAAGVNAAMREVMADPARRPALFDALDYEPEPWRPEDSLSVTMLFTYVIFAGEGEPGPLRNAELLGRLERRLGRRAGLAAWRDLILQRDPGAAAVVRRGEGSRPVRAYLAERPGAAQLRLARELGPTAAELGREIGAQGQRVEAVLERLPVPRIGSYAAAVSGDRTRSGGGLLVGSPQAGMNAPPVFYQLGQHAPGRACTGFTVPGLGPWTGVGWCNGHAWSLVAGNAGDQVDTYVERLHPSDPRRYLHRGDWVEMTSRRETFRVNRCAPPVCSEPSPARTVELEFDDTVHGPVSERSRDGRFAVVQRRAQRGRWGRSMATIVGWNEARSLREFDAATRPVTASYNLLYADAAGHVLYRFTGLQPVRAPGFDRRLPMPGDGRAEWRGFVPQSLMPHVVDPPLGVIALNQGIESRPADWWPNPSGYLLGQASRVPGNRGLLLRAGRDLDVAATERLNPELLERRDWISARMAVALRRAIGRARAGDDPRVRTALELLAEWQRDGFARVDRDGDGLYDAPAMAIFGADNFNLPAREYPRTLWTELANRLLGDELGEEIVATDGGTLPPGGWLSLMSRLKPILDGRRARVRLGHEWVDDRRTPRRERLREHAVGSLVAAMDALEREFGTADARRWLRPVPETPFVPFGAAAPPPLRGFDHGTYSQIVDPRAGVGRYIMPPGNAAADSALDVAGAQAGRYPPHFADQRARYEAYGFFDMPHAPEQFRAGTPQVLVYAGP